MPTQWKSLSEARTGEQLAEDLVGPGGDVLLKQGAELGERAIAMLAQRGIDRVPVHVDLDPEVIEREARRIEAVLEQRFRHCAQDPVMQQVREITRDVLLANVGCEQ